VHRRELRLFGRVQNYLFPLTLLSPQVHARESRPRAHGIHLETSWTAPYRLGPHQRLAKTQHSPAHPPVARLVRPAASLARARASTRRAKTSFSAGALLDFVRLSLARFVGHFKPSAFVPIIARFESHSFARVSTESLDLLDLPDNLWCCLSPALA
jgi:hypothetical protein